MCVYTCVCIYCSAKKTTTYLTPSICLSTYFSVHTSSLSLVKSAYHKVILPTRYYRLLPRVTFCLFISST